MSHYAKIENGIVTQVIVADADVVAALEGTWVQTSYNTRGGMHYTPDGSTPDNGTALRGNYAGVGYVYDAAHDVFYAPQPYPSWTISAPTWTWAAPIAMPTSGGPYGWDETSGSWVTVSK